MSNKITDVIENLLDTLTSEHSRRAYASDWTRYCTWLTRANIDVLTARPRHVSGHLSALRNEGKSKKTIGRALSVIREMYGALVREDLLDSNPAREVKNLKIAHEPRTPVLTEEQVRALLAAPDDSWKGRRDKLCLLTLFGLGWRREEVAALRVSDFKDGTVTGVLKGRKTVTVGVPPWLQTAMQEWFDFANIEEDEPVFPRSDRNRSAVSGAIVYSIVKTAAEKARVPLSKATPHALRRTYITLSGERGVALKVRQLAVGHSSQATTELYDKARDAAKSAPGEVFADLIASKKED